MSSEIKKRRPKAIPIQGSNISLEDQQNVASELKPTSSSKRKPRTLNSDAVHLDKETITPENISITEPQSARIQLDERSDPESISKAASWDNLAQSKGWRWGSLFFACLSGLLLMGAGLLATQIVEGIFARSDILGWIALSLIWLAILTLVVLVFREIRALMRLSQLEKLKQGIDRAISDKDMKAAQKSLKSLNKIYGNRPDIKWNLGRFNEAQQSIFDADGLLEHYERTVVEPIDVRAAQEVSNAAKRISLVTALSPNALIDMAFVLYTNVKMIRAISQLYGGRPGSLGMIKLVRNIIAHLGVTGGLALTDGAIQQLLGAGLAGRLSARLGEGIINGLFTVRIGLAALDECRPMSFNATSPPSIKDVASSLIK